MTRLTTTGTRDSFERLHHPNGAHRGTARSANGSDLDHFEQAIRPHLAEHQDRVDECGTAFAHTPDRDIDPGPDCVFCEQPITTDSEVAEQDRTVHIGRLLSAFTDAGANVTAPVRREGVTTQEPRPIEPSPVLGLAIRLVRHFLDADPDGWQRWDDAFAAYVGDEIADYMTTYLPDPAVPLGLADEMCLTDSAMLTGPIRREITEPTTNLEHLARQWVERAMTRIVRHYYFDLTERKEAGQ